MKNPTSGTEPPMAFAVEPGTTWKRWAKHRTNAELQAISERLEQLKEDFGKPHQHAGLGVRRLSQHFFEFRISRDVRVVFALIKPNIIRLAMCGNHNEVRNWIKENS